MNFEQDVLGRFGGAFVPRGRNNDQPSYYSEAVNNTYVNAAGNYANNMNPFAGWLTQGIGSGLVAGISSVNPYIGLAAGGASLITGIPSLVSNISKRKDAQKAQAEQTERINRLRSIDKEQKDLSKRYTDLTAEFKATREALEALRAGNTNPEVSREQNKEQQQISKEINEQIANTNPVSRYNNLQIQRTASFTLNALPPVVRKRQVQTRSTVDRLGRQSIAGNFFALI